MFVSATSFQGVSPRFTNAERIRLNRNAVPIQTVLPLVQSKQAREMEVAVPRNEENVQAGPSGVNAGYKGNASNAESREPEMPASDKPGWLAVECPVLSERVNQHGCHKKETIESCSCPSMSRSNRVTYHR